MFLQYSQCIVRGGLIYIYLCTRTIYKSRMICTPLVFRPFSGRFPLDFSFLNSPTYITIIRFTRDGSSNIRDSLNLLLLDLFLLKRFPERVVGRCRRRHRRSFRSFFKRAWRSNTIVHSGETLPDYRGGGVISGLCGWIKILSIRGEIHIGSKTRRKINTNNNNYTTTTRIRPITTV